MTGGNHDLAFRVAQWAGIHCAGRGKVRIEVELVDGQVELLVVQWKPAPGSLAGCTTADPWADFEPTESQSCVLEVLEGVALKGKAIEEASGLEHSQMFRVLRQLQTMDPPMVARHPSLGYYRLDAPPPQLAGGTGP